MTHKLIFSYFTPSLLHSPYFFMIILSIVQLSQGTGRMNFLTSWPCTVFTHFSNTKFIQVNELCLVLMLLCPSLVLLAVIKGQHEHHGCCATRQCICKNLWSTLCSDTFLSEPAVTSLVIWAAGLEMLGPSHHSHHLNTSIFLIFPASYMSTLRINCVQYILSA